MRKIKAIIRPLWLAWEAYQFAAAVGLMAVSGTVAFALVDELRALQFHWQALFLLGVFLLSLFVVWLLWPLVIRFRAPEPDRGGNASRQDRGVIPFNCGWLQAEIARHGLHLMHVGDRDPYIDFTFDVANSSGLPVRITGFSGTVRIGDNDCNLPHSLKDDQPRNLPPESSSRVPCVLRQPITDGIARLIADPALGAVRDFDTQLRFDLSGVRFVGSYKSGTDERSLPNDCYLRVTFLLRGPVRNDEDAKSLFKTETAFVSNTAYDSAGNRKVTAE